MGISAAGTGVTVLFSAVIVGLLAAGGVAAARSAELRAEGADDPSGSVRSLDAGTADSSSAGGGAPDGSTSDTVFHASVSFGGKLAGQNSSQVSMASKVRTGIYVVVFTTDVSACGRVAALGTPSDQQNNSVYLRPALGGISTIFDPLLGGIAVATFDSDGTPTDMSFQLIVACEGDGLHGLTPSDSVACEAILTCAPGVPRVAR